MNDAATHSRADEPELPKVRVVAATKACQRVIAVDGGSGAWHYSYTTGEGKIAHSAARSCDFTDIRQLYPITREAAERAARKFASIALTPTTIEEIADLIMEELGQR